MAFGRSIRLMVDPGGPNFGSDATDPFRAPPPAQVARLAVRSAKWAVVTVIVRQVILFGSTMIVSRFVTPSDAGIAAMALTVMAFVVLLDTALTWATVQPTELSKAQVDGMFWLSVFVGGVLWVACAILGGPLSAFFTSPQLATVMPVIGLAALFNSLSTQPAALMKRQLRQKASNLIDSAGVLAGAAVAVVMAVNGWGYWALIFQFVTMHALRAVLFGSLAKYKPSGPRFPSESWRLLRVGGTIALSNYICYFQLYLGSILMGRLFGASDLGFYSKASAVKSMPTQYATMVVTDVMVASLSALKDDPARMAAAYRKALAMTAMIGCPAGAFLYVAAPEVVAILYGPQWQGSVPMLRAFSIAAATLPISTTTIWLFLATARARTQLLLNIALTLTVMSIFAAGLLFWDSATDLVTLESLISATLLLGANVVVSHRAAQISLGPTLRMVGAILVVSAISLALPIVYLGDRVAPSGMISVMISLGLKGLLYGGVYALLIAPVAFHHFPAITSIVRARFRLS